jgi:hypothetical protein
LSALVVDFADISCSDNGQPQQPKQSSRQRPCQPGSAHPGSPPSRGAKAQPTVAVPKKQKNGTAVSSVVGDFADLSCSDSGQPQLPKQSRRQRPCQSASAHLVSPPSMGAKSQPTLGVPKKEKKGAAVSAIVGDLADLSCSDTGQPQQPKQSRHQGPCQSVSAHPGSPPSMRAKAQPTMGVPKKQKKKKKKNRVAVSALVVDFADISCSENGQPQQLKQSSHQGSCQSLSAHPGSPPSMGAKAQPTVAVPKKQKKKKKKAALSAVVGDFADLSCSDSAQPQPKQSNHQHRCQSASAHPVSPPSVGPQSQPTVGIPKEQKNGAAVSAPVGDFAALSCSDSGQLQQPKQSRHQGTCQSLSAHPVSPPSMAAKAQPPVGVPKKQRKGPTESSLLEILQLFPFLRLSSPSHLSSAGESACASL